MHTMTERKGKAGWLDVKELVAGDVDLIRAVVQATLHSPPGSNRWNRCRR